MARPVKRTWTEAEKADVISRHRKGESVTSIGKVYGVDRQALARRMNLWGIETKQKPRNPSCTYKLCDKPTPPTGGRLCDMHRSRKRIGYDMDAPLMRAKGTGTFVEGYIRVGKPSHPNADKNGYVMEHIIVMTELLGRALLPGENVHHKNGIRHDNRPENLELWVVRQPKGQRPDDLLEWADEIIRRYRTNVSK